MQPEISKTLFKELDKIITSYPDGIVKNVKSPLRGTAFFPGGYGTYLENNTVPSPKPRIMILGQDYDNEHNYEKLYNTVHQSEVQGSNRTWNFLLNRILHEKINPADCFFTNAIMGLRTADSKNNGRSKSFLKQNEMFLNENIVFFKKQLEIVQPKLIIGLGANVPGFIGKCFDIKDLSKIKSFKELDKTDFRGIKSVPNHEINIIFLTHPCMYDANVKNRKDVDEMKLIKEGLASINYTFQK